MVVFGTRPEVIKLAPLVALGRAETDVELVACSSGQHRQMLDQALSCFDLTPDIDLGLMREQQTLPSLTSLLITHMSQTIADVKPDAVVVQGDTTTAFAAALSAVYNQVPVAHVEAGLRTHDLYSPFPEEANRAMIGRLARWHFTPTPQASANLTAEGISPEAILECGNTVIDAIGLIQNKWEASPFTGKAAKLFQGRDLILVTTHRRENFGQGLENICDAIAELAQSYPQLGFVFPVHLNPNVRQVVQQRLADLDNLQLIEPVDFETSLYLQSRAKLILTDSGGIQEESPSFGVPAVVMREHTERREGIDAGFATLAGTDRQKIVSDARQWLDDQAACNALSGRPNPYGDGRSSERILQRMLSDLTNGRS
ncbi:UDP-N-acetylglucosamine 2-epimerase (non-hydrolyzing) [Hydrogenophaga sp. 5NK40-0174]